MSGFGHILLSAIAALGLFTRQSIISSLPHSSLTPTPTVQNGKMITASQTVNQFGETASFSASFPEKGGTITGSISGDCTGKVHGQYSGDNNGKKLFGTVNATCPVLFFNISGFVSFSGTVNTNDTNAALNYVAHVNGNSHNGTATLPLTAQ